MIADARQKRPRSGLIAPLDRQSAAPLPPQTPDRETICKTTLHQSKPQATHPVPASIYGRYPAGFAEKRDRDRRPLALLGYLVRRPRQLTPGLNNRFDLAGQSTPQFSGTGPFLVAMETNHEIPAPGAQGLSARATACRKHRAS